MMKFLATGALALFLSLGFSAGNAATAQHGYGHVLRHHRAQHHGGFYGHRRYAQPRHYGFQAHRGFFNPGYRSSSYGRVPFFTRRGYGCYPY